jgi:phosphoribosyl 1,2-cyclic phosphodiesterase
LSELAERQLFDTQELREQALAGDAGIASIGSGSKGNGTVVSLAGANFLVDCGFSMRGTTARLRNLGLRPGDINAIFVSHEHSDHASGVAALAHKFAIPVFATHGTRKSVKGGLRANTLTPGQVLQVDGVDVLPVTVPHDAREPTQFVFSANGVRLGVLSDLGHCTPHVVESYQQLDGLLMEANHDRELLFAGRYPPSVQRRVAGDLGHLSNEQAAALLGHIAHPKLQVVIGHVSEQNNDLAKLAAVFAPLQSMVASLEFATQADGHPWVAFSGLN